MSSRGAPRVRENINATQNRDRDRNSNRSDTAIKRRINSSSVTEKVTEKDRSLSIVEEVIERNKSEPARTERNTRRKRVSQSNEDTGKPAVRKPASRRGEKKISDEELKKIAENQVDPLKVNAYGFDEAALTETVNDLIDNPTKKEFKYLNPVKLHEAQKSAVKLSYEYITRHGYCYNSSEPGIGKTVMIMALVKALRIRHKKPVKLLVVIPAAIRDDRSSPWVRECERYGEIDNLTQISIETLRPKQTQTNVDEYSLNYMETYRGNVSDNINFRNYSSEGFKYSKKYREEELYGKHYRSQDEEDSYYSDEDIGENVSEEEFVSSENFEPEYGDMGRELLRVDFEKHRRNKAKGNRKNEKIAVYDYKSIVSPTKILMKFCEDENHIVVLVIDEAHKGKNQTAQKQAYVAVCRAISRARVLRSDAGAYTAFLSATPMDKKEHSASYMEMIGFENPLNPGHGIPPDMFIFPGRISAYESYIIAKRFNAAKAMDIALNTYGIIANKTGTRPAKNPSVENNSKAIYHFFEDCVLPEIHVSVLAEQHKALYNAFIDIRDETNKQTIEDAHKLLLEAAEKAKVKDIDEDLDDRLGLFTESRIMIEGAMVEDIVRIAKKFLDKNPRSRVLLGFNYLENVREAISLFGSKYGKIGRVAGKEKGVSGYQPYVVNGEKAIEKFRTFGIRIIVATIPSISTGRDLHDQIYRPDGEEGYQVFMFMPADYDLTAIQQFFGRAARFGTQTIPVGMLFYSKHFGENIRKIYNSIVDKTSVARTTLNSKKKIGDDSEASVYQQVYASQLVLPGEYNKYIELDCPIASAIKERANLSVDEDGKIVEDPPNFDENYKWLWENDAIGRMDYKDTSKLISFMEQACAKIDDDDELLRILDANGVAIDNFPDAYQNPYKPGTETDIRLIYLDDIKDSDEEDTY